MASFGCPVCNWLGLDKEAKWPFPTHEICECCGTQFGLDVQENSDMVKVRDAWLNSGATWFDDLTKPNNWSIKIAKQQIG